MTPVMYSDISGYAPEWIEDTGRFLGGLAIFIIASSLASSTSMLASIPGLASVPLFYTNMVCYGAVLMTSAFNQDVQKDMESIGWNPFNSDTKASTNANHVSFYKGVLVFKYGSKLDGSGISIIGVGLGRGANASTLMHEYGHHKQQRLMGIGLYLPIVAIPSLISAQTSTYKQHNNRWYEQWATDWGNGGWLW